MSEIIKKTVELVEDFNDEIKSDLVSKRINNTGRALNSIRIETDESNNKVSSIGVDYIEILDKGRGPGKFPPVDAIVRWVETKPVEIDPYVVGLKIAREGTNIYNNPSLGLQIDEKILKLRDNLKRELPKIAKADVINRLVKFTKERLEKNAS